MNPFHFYFEGLFLGLGLISAIGAQNIFVMQQSLQKNRAVTIALVCALCDVFLILLGVYLSETFIHFIPKIQKPMIIAGSGFLLFYGFNTLKHAWQLKKPFDDSADKMPAKKWAMMIFTVTFLNPHALLDSLVLIGGSSQSYSYETRPLFVMGTITASFLWFFGLVTVCLKASKWVKTLSAWKKIEGASGLLMVFFGVKLLLGVL